MTIQKRVFRLVAFACILVWAGGPGDLLFSQESKGHPYNPRVWNACNQFLKAEKRVVDGKSVGQEDCLMQERTFVFQGRNYRRADMAISGTIEGYVLKQGGLMGEYFNADPEFVFTQFGRSGWVPGIARYEGSAGVGISIFYPDPESASAWNGKAYYHVHGGGLCASSGEDNLTSGALKDTSPIDELMLEKGYVVVKTRRAPGRITRGNLIAATDKGKHCSAVTLQDGTLLIDVNFTEHAPLHRDLLDVGKNFIRDRLGRSPSRTYWYGHSSGGRVARLFNYRPELNRGQDGKPVIDGFLNDDTAAGYWYPVLYKDGKDVLFTNQEQNQLIKQIEIAHLLDGNYRRHPLPSWVSPLNLVNKRRSAKMMMDKGLGKNFRIYEVRDAAHTSASRGPRGDSQHLDLLPLIDGLIDLLDDWVEKGVEPPPNKSDWPDLGDPDGDGFDVQEALALPDSACPLGVYYPFPPSQGFGGGLRTSFAPFDANKLEPLDGRGVFVDMNRNGLSDMRESVTQAWRRLGLLKPGEKFSRQKCADCVRAAVAPLQKEGFLSEKRAAEYLEQASKRDLPER